MRTLAGHERPVRSPDVVAERSGNDHIVHRDTHEDFALNPTAFALWELCDGRTTVREMVLAVYDLFDVTMEQAHRDVTEGLARMREAGIVG